MLIDDQLRAAFAANDDSWQASTDLALQEVVRRHRRGVALGRAAVAGAVAAVVATVAILLGGGLLDSDASPDPVGPPSPLPEATGTPSFGVTPLQGRWRTAPLDEAALRQALASAGDGTFGDDVIGALPPAPFRLVWEVDRGTAQLRAVAGAGTTVLDETSVVVEDEIVTMTPRFAEGYTLHRLTLVGDELRLRFVSTTEPAMDGIPGGVWQRLLYDGFGFTRS